MNVQIGDKLQNVNQMLSAQIESIWAEKRQTVRLLGGLTIDTPEGNSRRSWSGPRRASGPRGTAGGTRATGAQTGRRPSRPDHARPTQLWAAAIQPAPA